MSVSGPDYTQIAQTTPRLTETCLRQIPSQIICDKSRDCRDWMQKNCSDEDKQRIKPYCDIGGHCVFPTDGRQPPFTS